MLFVDNKTNVCRYRNSSMKIFPPFLPMLSFTRSVMSDSYGPMDCRPPNFSIHGTSQARILEWIDISFFDPEIKLASSADASGRFFTAEPHGKPQCYYHWTLNVCIFVDVKLYLFVRLICITLMTHKTKHFKYTIATLYSPVL